MSNLRAVVYGNKVVPTLRFENVRSSRTVVVERAVVVSRTAFARKPDGKLIVFDLNRSVHHSADARGALLYIEAAWRLGVLKKAVHDGFVRRWEEREKRNAMESDAANALDYAKAAGVELPSAVRKVLEKKAGRS